MTAYMIYSCTVNVNCLLLLLSKRCGGFISISMVIATDRIPINIEHTKMPDHMGTVINPTQS